MARERTPAEARVTDAVRAYLARMFPAHLGSYALALAAAWAGSRLAGAFAALVAGATAFGLANALADRYATSAASAGLVANVEWVAWAVLRLLERATAQDRRGRRAASRVAALTDGDAAAPSRAGRAVLARVQHRAVDRVADVLARTEAGDEPLAARVHRSVAASLARERAARAVALGTFAAAVLALAAVAALSRSTSSS